MDNLTLCIPTFKRRKFLDWTVTKTLKDFPKSKIVISNNDPNDVINIYDHIEVIEQPQNIGPFPNMRAALLAAKTKYCMYLGDDDYLLPDEVVKGIDFLESNSNVIMYCAPCALWNEVDNVPRFEAFSIIDDETFYNEEDPALLWNFIILKHVWPEHIIYRRKGLEEILKFHGSVREYWAFTDLAEAFRLGDIHFAKIPFYRNIVEHPVGGREKLGDRQCLTDFDNYRGGLEYLAYRLFNGRLNEQIKTGVQQMITRFIGQRLGIAADLLENQNILDQAHVYRMRMRLAQFGRND